MRISDWSSDVCSSDLSEVSVDTDAGRLRPDVIVSLPGGRKLVIDAKCSLNAYLDASQEVDDGLRTAHLKAHAASIRTHAQQLGANDYWARFGKARSEEHTSELQSLRRISSADFCLK